MLLSRTQRGIAAGSRIRVLVVDDSVVIRRLVTHALEEDPLIEVVGSASNGVVALARIPQVNPDVITLDIEMPEMDGLQALPRIRSLHPNVRVIMFSTLTDRGAAATFQALALGADDYVTKVANVGSLDDSIKRLRGELIPKIKQFFKIGTPPAAARAVASVISPAPKRSTSVTMPKVVVIGVSTGGPAALGRIMPEFERDFPLPILIVQHMPPLFTRLLAERLHAISKLTVNEATEGAYVEAGKVLIAPGDFHMRLERVGQKVTTVLDQSPPENSCRPAVDVLFQSAAEIWGAGTLAVILTGMGKDGLRGTQSLRSAGAYVIAQDEASSVVWGMPGAVANAGLCDTVTPLDRVVPEILRQLGRS